MKEDDLPYTWLRRHLWRQFGLSPGIYDVEWCILSEKRLRFERCLGPRQLEACETLVAKTMELLAFCL